MAVWQLLTIVSRKSPVEALFVTLAKLFLRHLFDSVILQDIALYLLVIIIGTILQLLQAWFLYRKIIFIRVNCHWCFVDDDLNVSLPFYLMRQILNTLAVFTALMLGWPQRWILFEKGRSCLSSPSVEWNDHLYLWQPWFHQLPTTMEWKVIPHQTEESEVHDIGEEKQKNLLI